MTSIGSVRRALRPNGGYVTLPDVERLKELIAAGSLRPVIDRRYPLSQVVDALRHVDEGRARGKVVVVPDEA